MNCLLLAWYWTVQPACVHTALNAANFPAARHTIQAGSPVAGSLNSAASPTGTAVTGPTLMPDGVPCDAGAWVGLVGPLDAGGVAAPELCGVSCRPAPRVDALPPV